MAWSPSREEKNMVKIPAPPVPPRLREMLKDYPALIQEVQDGLDSLVRKMAAEGAVSLPPFEEAVWYLEDTLDAFYSRAQEELDAAEVDGDLQAIDKAKAKRHLMGRTASDRPWNDEGDQSLWSYFRRYKAAFK
jgi:hypothetical protein